MESIFDSKRLIRLGLYTSTAAELITQVLTFAEEYEFWPYCHQRLFSDKYGIFGEYGRTAYVIVMPDGELALEKCHRETKRGIDCTLSNEDTLNVLKHIFTAFIELYKANVEDYSVWKWERDDSSILASWQKTEIKKRLNNAIAILKHLNGKKLIKDEKLIVGRQLNPFEQIEFNRLLEKFYEQLYNSPNKKPSRRVIQYYIKKMQSM